MEVNAVIMTGFVPQAQLRTDLENQVTYQATTLINKLNDVHRNGVGPDEFTYLGPPWTRADDLNRYKALLEYTQDAVGPRPHGTIWSVIKIVFWVVFGVLSGGAGLLRVLYWLVYVGLAVLVGFFLAEWLNPPDVVALLLMAVPGVIALAVWVLATVFYLRESFADIGDTIGGSLAEAGVGAAYRRRWERDHELFLLSRRLLKVVEDEAQPFLESVSAMESSYGLQDKDREAVAAELSRLETRAASRPVQDPPRRAGKPVLFDIPGSPRRASTYVDDVAD